MISWASIGALLMVGLVAALDQESDWSRASSVYEFHAVDLDGRDVSLDKYRGNVLVVFNGATKGCPVSSKGFKLLQALQERLGPDGLSLVGFVVDGLTKESGSSDESRQYLDSINVTFDMYAKIRGDGDGAHPLYKWIKSQLPADDNKIPVASKILIDRSGRVISKYPPTGPLTQLENDLKQYL
nr:peroxidase [Aphelinus asychis]